MLGGALVSCHRVVFVGFHRAQCTRFRLPTGALVPWRFLKKRRTFEVQVDGPLISTEPSIAIRAAIDGAGLIQLPLAYLAPDIDAGRLVTVLTNWDQPRIDALFLYYSRTYLKIAD
jgi:DNA-binding transcriptional LysR family regulator